MNNGDRRATEETPKEIRPGRVQPETEAQKAPREESHWFEPCSAALYAQFADEARSKGCGCNETILKEGRKTKRSGKKEKTR